MNINKYMKRGWLLSGLTAAAMLASCSQENVEPVETLDVPGTVRITLALPGGEGVVYPTRAIHTQEEWEIKRLLIFDMKQNDNSEWELYKVLEPTNLTPIGNGQYTLSFSEDSEEIGKQHKFIFFGNRGSAEDEPDFDQIIGSTEDVIYDSFYEEILEDQLATLTSDHFTQNGISMGGIATESKGSVQNVLTITNGTVDCHVEMIRNVGRVDLYSNAPNLVITGATMRNAEQFCHLHPNFKYSRDEYFAFGPIGPVTGSRDVTIGFNANFTDALAQGNPQAYTPETFAEKQTAQSYPDNGVRKAFYMYERPNMEGDCLEVEVEYMLRDGSKGTVIVPFMKEDKTTGEKTYVDAERNHLYKIVLGNGEEVENGSDVTAEIIDEPWNVVDLPAVIPGAGGDDTGGDTGGDTGDDDDEETVIRKQINYVWAVKMRNAMTYGPNNEYTLPEMWVAECNEGAEHPYDLGNAITFGSSHFDESKFANGSSGSTWFPTDDYSDLLSGRFLTQDSLLVATGLNPNVTNYDMVSMSGHNFVLPTMRDMVSLKGGMMPLPNSTECVQFESLCEEKHVYASDNKITWSDGSETDTYGVAGMYLKSKQTGGIIFIPRYSDSQYTMYWTRSWISPGKAYILNASDVLYSVGGVSIEKYGLCRGVIYQ